MKEGQRAEGEGRFLLAALLFLLAALLAPATVDAQSLVIVVHHAERADGGAGASTMTSAPADPSLSAAGEARAAKLAAMLADSGVKAIYATEFKRTQETGRPLAAGLGLTVQTVPARDTVALVSGIKSDHPRDIVLVIGHSNTVPELVKAFGGGDIKMADAEYDAIYIVNPANGAVILMRY